jgi:Pyridoxamine 5'-phosphate oxidase
MRIFDPETVALLESGCSISVATVGPDGAPHASRAYGLTVLADGVHGRLLLDADDGATLANLAGGGPIAVTGVAVPTLRAIQVKGTADEPIPTSDAGDLGRAARHLDSFFTNVNSVEGTPIALLERLRPAAFAVCTITVTEVFDQTPGPSAGSRVGTSAP